MLDNIIIGPMVLFNNEKVVPQQCLELSENDWLPFLIIRKGQLFNSIKYSMPVEQQLQLKGIILSIGFKKIYLS